MAFLKKLLAERSRQNRSFDWEAYKKRLLEISVWGEEELAVFDEVRGEFEK